MRIIHTSLSAKRSVVRQCADFIFQRLLTLPRGTRSSVYETVGRPSVRPSVCHWRQPSRGCRGHIPQYFGWGDVNGNIPQYYYIFSDIADRYWLPSVRSASSRFHSAIRRHQFASVRQADSRLTRLVPPSLELALTPLSVPSIDSGVR